MENYELIKFTDNQFELNVNVSPEGETVWLSLTDIAALFERDKSVISRHIKNIFKEKELDENRTIAKNATVQIEGLRQVERTTELYNLDVIISVGYRVKSHRGVMFRKWANDVLKQYLLKGYVLDKNRVIISKNNYIQLENDVVAIKKEIKDIKEKMFIEPIKERLFFNGEYFDAYDFIVSLLESAENEIVIIDPYFDRKSLKYLENINKEVSINIYLSKNAKLSNVDIQRFEEQYNKLNVIEDNLVHDRFIILDKSKVYLIGTSLNYIGKKAFAVHKIEDNELLNLILSRIKD